MSDYIAIGFVSACVFVTACFSGLSYYVLCDILKKTGAFVVIIADAKEKNNEKV